MKHLENNGKSASVICAVNVSKMPTPHIAVKGDDVDLLTLFTALAEYLMEERHFTALDMWSVFDSVITDSLFK